MTYLFQELVTDLYQTFRTPATILDPYNRVLAHSDQPVELADEWRRSNLLVDTGDTELGKAVIRHVNDFAHTVSEVTRIPAAPELGLLERVVIPLLARGVATAYIYLIDPDHRVQVESLEPFQPAFTAAAKQVELERLARFRVRAAVAGVISGDETERRVAIDTLEDVDMVALPPMRAAVLQADTPVDRISDNLWGRILGAESVWSEVGGRIVAVLGEFTERSLRGLRDRIDADNQVRVYLGLGSPVDEIEQVRSSYRQAIRGLTLARSRATDTRFAVWEELGPWRPLLSLSRDDALASLDPRVHDLVAGEDLATLQMVRSYLERAASADAIADEHHLHRTTLYERFRRLQDRYTLHWEVADDRLATVLGIRIALLHGQRRANPPQSAMRQEPG